MCSNVQTHFPCWCSNSECCKSTLWQVKHSFWLTTVCYHRSNTGASTSWRAMWYLQGEWHQWLTCHLADHSNQTTIWQQLHWLWWDGGWALWYSRSWCRHYDNGWHTEWNCFTRRQFQHYLNRQIATSSVEARRICHATHTHTVSILNFTTNLIQSGICTAQHTLHQQRHQWHILLTTCDNSTQILNNYTYS